MTSKTQIFSDLMRDLEVDMGTRDLTELVLLSLIDAIKAYKGSKFETFCEQYHDFAEMVKNTEPKFGIFRFYFGYLEKEITGKVCNLKDNKDWKPTAIKKIKETLKYSKSQRKKLLKNAEKINVDGKIILIHDHSHTVQDVLANFKRRKKKFKVVIAEQDYKKTQDNIEMLHNADIPFTVVPAYMLSHVHSKIDMVFYGALTLKDSQEFVMNPGALSIITEFQIDKTPIYMFMGTDKFSLWKSQKRGEIFIHKHKRTHISKPIEYERTKYSHDRVPSKFFRKIVTNEGIFNAEELRKVFDKAYKENN